MKTLLKIKIFLKTLIPILVISLIFSCKKNIDDNNPQNNDDNTECMAYKDINSIVHNSKHLFFLNENEGWIIGKDTGGADPAAGKYILLHTNDGGQNWTVTNSDLGFGTYSIYGNGTSFKFRFTTSTHGYMSLNLPMMDTDNKYYYTNDGGASWQPVPLPTISTDENLYMYGMGVNDAQMVFAALIDNNSTDIDDCYRLYFVSNATHSITGYVNVDCFTYPDVPQYRFSPRDISFTNDGTINMVISSGPNSSPHLIYIAHSIDAGNSWTYTQIDYKPSDLSYFEFVNNNVGYLPINTEDLGTDRVFYKTTDGGATWTKKIAHLGDNGGSILHMSFADENNGLAVRLATGNGLYKTTDGGDTWNRVGCYDDPNNSIDIWTTPVDIVYPSVNTGIILGAWMDSNGNGDTENRVYFYTD